MKHRFVALLIIVFITCTGQAFAAEKKSAKTAAKSSVKSSEKKEKANIEKTNIVLFDLKEGQTLPDLISELDVDPNHQAKALKALDAVYNTKDMFVGQQVRVVVQEPKKKGQALSLNSIQIKLANNKRIESLRLSGDNFIAEEIIAPTLTKFVKVKGEVETALFSPELMQQVPEEIRQLFIKNYSYDVDLQREIKAGDRFSFIFERLYDQDGQLVGTGNIVYSSLTVSGETHDIYYYEMADGQSNYFDENGETIRKSLLKTPIDGARITSTFGLRKHPILGFTKEHKGLDFGAPEGTPIYSAGKGTITQIGKNGAYGNYIKVQHDGKYSTAYAHMSKFAKNLKAGTKVSQGQIIGYVGSTGRSTGAHLHYEVIADGSQINPLSVKNFASSKLAAMDLAAFKKYKQTVFEISNRLDAKDKVASNR